MEVLTAPSHKLKSFLLSLESLLEERLCFVKHILFQGCIYITPIQHNDEVEEENFYLIYELKKDRGGLSQAEIHFLQIPKRMRGRKLGSRVYLLLEELLKSQGCTSIVLEARVNTLNPKDNSVSFWARQGFIPGVHNAFDDENFPMRKILVKI